jgi:hypothetical protein
VGGHELVLFDIDRMEEIEPILRWDPRSALEALRDAPDRTFRFSLVTNATERSRSVVVRSRGPGEEATSELDLGLAWPDDVYSLSHVALPFPPDDTLYGPYSVGDSPGIELGDLALRGERGVLQIPAADMLRLRWNPFYPYVETRALVFLGLIGR